MAKTVNDVLGKIKGEDKIADVLTGKGSFSKTGFSDMVTAMVNDTSFKIPTYDKDGNKTGEVNLSTMIRNDLKKTVDKAKYPQKPESGVLDTCEIAANGLAEAIPYIVEQWNMCGKKFEYPNHPKFAGGTYLHPVEASQKTVTVRDPKTQTNLGTAEITTKPYIQIRSKSSAPSYLQTKVRKDANGKVIK